MILLYTSLNIYLSHKTKTGKAWLLTLASKGIYLAEHCMYLVFSALLY